LISRPAWKRIAANVAILLLAYAVGTLSSATAGFGCFYKNMSMGRECDPFELSRRFWESFVLAAVALYALWIVAITAWRLFKKAN
jgi:hypothetical protein